jgi:hypothetical protein
MSLAAFLVQSDPSATPLRVIVLNAHLDDCADPSEGVDHHRDKGAVTQTHHGRRIDFLEEFAGFVLGQHRRLAFLDRVFRSPHRRRGVRRHDLPDDKPIEQHPNSREVLLDRRLREPSSQLLYISGHMEGLYIDDLMEALERAPAGKFPDRMQISAPSIHVPDIGREVLDEPFGGLGIWGVQRRHSREIGARGAAADQNLRGGRFWTHI